MSAAGKQKNIFIVSILFVFCIYSNAWGCNKKVSDPDSVKTILFVGNSLTYTNNLPGLVTLLGKEKGLTVKTEMIAYPNYGLEDHWNDGSLQTLLAEKHFDFVVVQQGPSSQNEGRIMLLDYGTRIKALCETHNAKLAFFMVWPAFSNLHTFDALIKNYTDAAAATNSLLCPVGEVWKKHFLEASDYSYYGPDLFHPSPQGSGIAAQIIYETLFK